MRDSQPGNTKNNKNLEFPDFDSYLNYSFNRGGPASRLNKQPKKRIKTDHLAPITFGRLNTSLGTPKPKSIKILCNSGGSATILKSSLAKKLRRKDSKEIKWSTLAGEVTTTKVAKVQFSLPELQEQKLINYQVHLTDQDMKYDMIMGRDLLQELGININFKNMTLEWEDHAIEMKSVDATEQTSFAIADSAAVEGASSRLKKILDAKYEAANLDEIVATFDHLTIAEKADLLKILKKYSTLFDGTLGNWRDNPYEIELKEGVKPYHARCFPIPKVHEQTLRVEVERLCKLGVLKRVNRSEWAAPTFVIPKKDGTVRFISDFRELNKRIKRKPYPLPTIQDLLLKLEGFQYATSLDLNMGYYHVELHPHSKELCTIVLPWGKYEYQRLPMGLCNSPDIFQEKMATLFAGLDYVRTYIDDLLIFTKGDFTDHMHKLELVLQRLQQAGLKVNAKKSFFARAEVEYLGYWVTREGIQPLPKKVEAIQNIATPTKRKELRRFIGMVNYYRDMWVRRSDVLAPLASLTSDKTPWKWTAEHQHAFETMKKIISRETLLSYPDFNQTFHIYTDASDKQLGAVIAQNDRPIAFYSRKLAPAQTRYTTTERELLAIVETLKEFRNILLGHKIMVHTDPKNLTYKQFNTHRVMRWRLIIEEFGPEFTYIEGPNNIVADALSRLDIKTTPPLTHLQIAECFGQDEIDTSSFPIRYASLEKAQQRDKSLLLAATRDSNDLTLRTFYGEEKPLICSV